MRNPLKRLFTISVLLCLLVSCKDSYSFFSNKYPVNFSYGTHISPFEQITSMGRFITVRLSGVELVATDMDGTTYRYVLTEMESRSFRMGCAGLIIGTPILDNDDISVRAYDLVCPICDNIKYRLRVTSNGEAVCSHCSSRFDLNNNGFVLSSNATSPRPLYRYQANIGGNGVSVRN